MPMPIKMVGERDSLDGIFHYLKENDSSCERGMSELQKAFLASTNGAEFASASRKKPNLSASTIGMLERIDASHDEIITAASDAAGIGREGMYRVPAGVSDYDMTALKAQGLIEGRGRVVAFTNTARIALRDHWLKQTSLLSRGPGEGRFIHPDSPDYVRKCKASNKTDEVRGTDDAECDVPAASAGQTQGECTRRRRFKTTTDD